VQEHLGRSDVQITIIDLQCIYQAVKDAYHKFVTYFSLVEIDTRTKCYPSEFMPMSDAAKLVDYTTLKTSFARHKLDYAVQYLWDERKIAIHWESIPSSRSEDYEEGRAATEISNLNQIAEEGAIVGASYREEHKNRMLVGTVEPGSQVKLLVIDEMDGSIHDLVSIEPGTEVELSIELDNFKIYKSVQMTDTEVVTRQEQPLLFDDGVRPPFWSVCEWDGAEEQLRAIAQGDLPPYEVGSLTTDQLEIACEEFLRIVDDDYSRTAEIGGTTSDIDIMGVSDDELVWAQVTQGGESDVENKIQNLGDYTEEDARVIIFAPESARPAEIDDQITFISVEGVFSAVNLNNKGSALLSRMLGREE
jgi:hypothetical protein